MAGAGGAAGLSVPPAPRGLADQRRHTELPQSQGRNGSLWAKHTAATLPLPSSLVRDTSRGKAIPEVQREGILENVIPALLR